MRLIDGDALMETIKQNDYMLADKTNSMDRGMFTLGIQQAIDEQPTIDPVKRGEWIAKKMNDGAGFDYTNYWCSVCDRKLIGYSNPADCPYCHCGALMSGADMRTEGEG